MIKVIFLDIDGVLGNCEKRGKNYKFNNKKQNKIGLCKFITKRDIERVNNEWNKTSIRILKKLIKKYNFYIIIISNWRLTRSCLYFKLLFSLIGLQKRVAGIISDCGTDKKRGIENYLKTHNVSQALIIDDEFLNVEGIYQIKTNKKCF